ncbi:hypothetical protein HGRIS_009517 [Hohenbuehelia grisea]|uniref:TLC domain-containing protein n=1 Tax=Hohenbuehelia grisea TaxID=104357 RepID=A0ABR3J1T1_9AGAR
MKEQKKRQRQDPSHHLAGPFLPQTPFDSAASSRQPSPVPPFKNVYRPRVNVFIRWIVEPASAFKLLLVPLILYVNWELLKPYVAPNQPNPFTGIFMLSNPVPDSPADDPRYAKTYWDIPFIAYYVIFFSFVRQAITVNICSRVARYFGIKKEAKLARFGEQGYAMVYFAVFGAWGFRIMSHLPTWWYRTEYFWIDYPHWDMKPELKRYYLMQMAYWLQQLLVLLLGLEKPRKDYYELVAHHFVTLWLVGWSYLVNMTLMGNAVYMSMDIPDSFLAFSKILNYIQWERAKIVSFAVFSVVWTYFRHYLNLVILYSVWTEFNLIPEASNQWKPENGVWLAGWMRYQIFIPLALLQLLNLFWYFLILRILVRAVITAEATDERSDDEDDGDDADDAKED